MAYFWHIPTILGAVTLGGLSYQGVVKDDWTSKPLPPPNNSTIWSEANNGSGLSPAYVDLVERARTRDFSEMVVRMGDGVKRFVAPGSPGTQKRTTAAVLGNNNYYIGDTWYSGTTNAPRQTTQSKQATQPAARTTASTTTTQPAANQQVQQRTTSVWNSQPNSSQQVASNAPNAPALPSSRPPAFGQGGGYHIVIETGGGMREAQLIEQQLRQAGYKNVESWQKPNDGRVRIFVGEEMAPDVSDLEFAKLEKTLRTFTFYSEVTLLQL